MNYGIYLIILLILVLIYVIYQLTNPKKEHYDSRISGVSEDDCGKACTIAYGCQGFGYDSEKAKCYISKLPIAGQPSTNSLYSDEYSSGQKRCNKNNPIMPEVDQKSNITNYKKLQNTIYSCANNERDSYTLYEIVNGNITPIRKSDIKDLSYKPYELNEIEYPKFKKDMELIDIVGDQIEKNKNYMMFVKDMQEHLGQYLFPYKCVDNVSEKECLDTCVKYDDCTGVEWNPVYIENGKERKNVCCPKKIIDQIITRRHDFINGRFYTKDRPHELKKEHIYIRFDDKPSF